MTRSRMRATAVGRGTSPPRPASGISGGDSGMVLLETALAIPLLVAVTAAMCWGVMIAAATLQVGDAARSAARDLARGESAVAVVERANAAIPGALVRIADEGEFVAVTISQEVTAPVPILTGMTFTVRQQVAVPKEWT